MLQKKVYYQLSSSYSTRVYWFCFQMCPCENWNIPLTLGACQMAQFSLAMLQRPLWRLPIHSLSYLMTACHWMTKAGLLIPPSALSVLGFVNFWILCFVENVFCFVIQLHPLFRQVQISGGFKDACTLLLYWKDGLNHLPQHHRLARSLRPTLGWRRRSWP